MVAAVLHLDEAARVNAVAPVRRVAHRRGVDGVIRPGRVRGLGRVRQNAIDAGQRREAGTVDFCGASRDQEATRRVKRP